MVLNDVHMHGIISYVSILDVSLGIYMVILDVSLGLYMVITRNVRIHQFAKVFLLSFRRLY